MNMARHFLSISLCSKTNDFTHNLQVYFTATGQHTIGPVLVNLIIAPFINLDR